MPSSSELQELMRATARNLVYTVAGLYLIWHSIATVGYPRLFSPSLWTISLYMLALTLTAIRLMKKNYLPGQLLWLIGLAGAVTLAFIIYGRVEVLLLLLALPLMTVVTLGPPYAAAAIAFSGLLAWALIQHSGQPPIYTIAITLGSAFTAVFGWSVSSNLLAALNAASYHYNEATRLLEETRDHRAEISRMLKDRNQVNYQLERMNEMLSAARAQAEEARENRSRFMLAVSHELRSPLNFIIGFSDLMVNAPETYAPPEAWPPGLYDDAQEIYSSSRHLLRLINDILDMGKIDASQMSLYREKAAIEQVIGDVREMLSSAFEKKGIELRLEIAPKLPPVSMDTTRIRQVLLNLLNNGLRFTDQGSVTLRVEYQPEALQISVSDTGAGIAPADLPKVFDEFRQVGEENWRRRAGSGLGLYISRRFVELHGGTLRVESQLGEGTRFTFNLPLEAPANPGSESAGREHHPARRENRLLLVISPRAEDFSTLQRELDGYTLVHLAGSGQVAAAMLQHYPRAILLSAEAAALPVESLPYTLPVIRLTLPRAGLQSASVRAHLVKPVRRKTLLKTLENLPIELHSLLVIDDDPAMLRFVRQALRAEKREIRLHGAASAAEASALLTKIPVDALLLDLELPDMDGQTWLENLDPAYAHLPVIVISAQDAAEAAAAQGTLLEMNLQRPLRPAELGKSLRALLENIAPQYPAPK